MATEARKHGTDEPLGTPLPAPEGIDPAVLGMEWSLSPETIAAIEAVEANIRMARAVAPTILVD